MTSNVGCAQTIQHRQLKTTTPQSNTHNSEPGTTHRTHAKETDDMAAAKRTRAHCNFIGIPQAAGYLGVGSRDFRAQQNRFAKTAAQSIFIYGSHAGATAGSVRAEPGMRFGYSNAMTPRMFLPARRSFMASLMSSSLYFCVTSSSSLIRPASYIDSSFGMASRGFISP